MKILQLNCVYKEESTGKIVYDIHRELLNNGDDSIVCYGRGTKKNDLGTYRLCSNIYSKFCKFLCSLFGLKYSFSNLSTFKFMKIVKLEKPDIIHLHCINGNIVNVYKLLNKLLNESNYKIVLTLHAEFIYTGNCGYSLDCEKWMTGCGKCPRLKKETNSYFFDRTHKSWSLFYNVFSKHNDRLVVTSVSPWLYNRASISPILKNQKHEVVLNGIDCDVFHYKENEGEHYIKKYNLENKKVVLHVTASFTRKIKGGKYVIEVAKRMPDIVFLVVGCDNPNIDLPSNIINIGRINDQNELSIIYSLSNVFLLTSEKETFCMPVAESLACGTPVVGFRAGAPEEIAIPDFSDFVEFGNVELLIEKLNMYLSNSFDKKYISSLARNVYSKEKMYENYYKIYKELYYGK